jgi:hypothetical protein
LRPLWRQQRINRLSDDFRSVQESQHGRDKAQQADHDGNPERHHPTFHE